MWHRGEIASLRAVKLVNSATFSTFFIFLVSAQFCRSTIPFKTAQKIWEKT